MKSSAAFRRKQLMQNALRVFAAGGLDKKLPLPAVFMQGVFACTKASLSMSHAAYQEQQLAALNRKTIADFPPRNSCYRSSPEN